MNDSTFALETRVDGGYARFAFAHAGDAARDVKFHIGMIDGGVAMAGDGWDFGTVERDLLAIVFDAGQIDASTVRADYAIGVSVDTRFGLFVTWSSGDAPQVKATGVEMNFSTSDGFTPLRVLDGDEARAFLLGTGMVFPADLQPTAPEVDAQERYFDRLSVEGYRGFSVEKVLRFARPTHMDGSGLTILVGANNSGKSTFVEAIQLAAAARNRSELSIAQPRRHRDRDAVEIQLSREDGRRLTIRTRRVGGSPADATWAPESAGPGKFDIHVTPSRRSFTPYFGNSGVQDRDWGLMDQEFSRTQSRDNFVGRLRKVDQDAQARAKFDALLERIIGAPLIWTFDEIATSQQFIKLTDPAGAWHTSEGLGDGLVSLLFIVDALYDSEAGSLIAIDEPELSLHPQLVRRLRKVLSEYAADRQIVIATHSPLLIDWADIANGATVARVFKSEGHSDIAQASAPTLQATALLADNRNRSNPHTVGVVAREAFFLEDGIILTEGQDDVVYLPRVLDDLGLGEVENVYGWGSGGATNIPTLARLFRELGFTRIAVILDDDGQPETTKAHDELESMAPEVLVRRIPAPDIRYKKEVKPKAEVVGLLEKDGVHVRAELRDSTAAVLQDVLDHLRLEESEADQAPKAEPLA